MDHHLITEGKGFSIKDPTDGAGCGGGGGAAGRTARIAVILTDFAPKATYYFMCL
jgi:hypothetical protein